MGKLIDLTNQRFGFWIVIKLGSKSKNGQTRWLCRCECNRRKEVTSNSLRSGNSTSCGCNNVPDLTNITFGNLTVLKLHSHKNGVRKWICACICSKRIIVNTYKLREGIITSCGCDGLLKQSEACIDEGKAIRDKTKKIKQKTMELIRDQTRIIAELNIELQKSMDLLSKIKKK